MKGASPASSGRRLAVEVVNVVRAPVTPASVRSVVLQAAMIPEVAARLPDGPAGVAVRLTGDRELRRLNRDYAGIDSVTDVLSFGAAAQAGPARVTAADDGHVGDLAVSWPMVVKQAAEFGYPPQAELALLVVHGLLHLLGWDHATASERREMSRITVAALKRSRIKLPPGRL